jgi:hypothetical protein
VVRSSVAGNAFFKAKDYYQAKAKYTKIPLYLNHLDLPEVAEMGMMQGVSSGAKPTSEQLAKVKELRNVCYQNSAICCYQLKDYKRGLDFAERVSDDRLSACRSSSSLGPASPPVLFTGCVVQQRQEPKVGADSRQTASGAE